jgi:phosphomannomutase
MSDPEALARDFLLEDPDPETRAELRALLDRAEAGDERARRDLADRFCGPLEFGTAGLRGRVEAGLSRMNRLVVAKATWGLGVHLLRRAQGGPDPRERGVVVGFDGRYSSRAFAEEAAAVLAGLGIPVYLFPDPVPTPLLSFSVPRLRAAAGVMVTASHNPPADNGYKVYVASGAQILPPADAEISECIADAPRFDGIARLAPPGAAAAGRRTLVDVADQAVEEAYLEGLARAALHPRTERPPLPLAYTALHGVGHRLALRALARAGFEGVAAVASQCDADGAFRTVRSPNPEEPGTMDRVLALAAETGAELVLANDPDADRLAAAVPDPETGGYRMLGGNEVGVLLGDDALEHAETERRRKLVVTTLVSSSLLGRMARDRGASYRETLTGFKWIADVALRAEREGEAFVFGYEEALGYTVGSLVRDKDGIGSALRLAECARSLKARGKTLLERLDELLLAHGVSQTVQWSVRLPGREGRERIRGAMEALRSRPPQRIGASPVVRILDAAVGEERVGGERRPLDLPRSDVVSFQSEDGARIIARPSGTEPKIKFYVELVGRATDRAGVHPARERLARECAAVQRALTEELGLG